jgi:RNA polymerase sigma-70 factor (ECF subfamily)
MIVLTDIDSLVRTHQDGLRRYLRYLGCDDATADDLAQEAFVALLRGPFEERSPAATAAWLRKKARFLHLEHIRWRARRREAPLMEVADEVWATWAGDDDGDRYVEAMRRCLDALAPRARRAVDLRYGEGRGRAEIAALLGLAVNGVKTLIQRARASLRECVERRVRP